MYAWYKKVGINTQYIAIVMTVLKHKLHLTKQMLEYKFKIISKIFMNTDSLVSTKLLSLL